MLGDHVSLLENHEIQDGDSRVWRHGAHDGEDAGVGVVEGDGVHGVVVAQVVGERVVVAAPGDDVERVHVGFAFEELAEEFGVDSVLAFLLEVGGFRDAEVLRVGQAVRSNGSKFGQVQVIRKDLTNPALMLHELSSRDNDSELDASRNDCKMADFDEHAAHFGLEVQRAGLRDEEEVAVG